MNTTNKSQSIKSILRTLTIIHTAFCISIFLFGLAVLYITKNPTLNYSDTEDNLFYIVPILAIVAAFVSQYLFKKNILKAQKKSTLEDKIIQYQASKIMQFALIEAPAFLGIVEFLISSNLYYLIISAILLAYLISRRPTKTEIKTNLNFSAEQEREFRKFMT